MANISVQRGRRNAFHHRFLRSRREFIRHQLLTPAELDALRGEIDANLRESRFCDGCGFCCLNGVPMCRLEFERIQRLIDENPRLLRHQGMICPFLDLDGRRFNRSLKAYGRTHQSQPSFPCRIYDERPLVCRLYPAPHPGPCRQFNACQPPDLVKALLGTDKGGFPGTLIHKYYLTLAWEKFQIPDDVLDPALKYHLVPGWFLNEGEATLECREGPHWLHFLNTIPAAFPVPDSCALEPWEVDVVKAYRKPLSHLSVLERFSPSMSPERLGRFTAQLEICNMIVPIDIGERMLPGSRSFWSWKHQSICPRHE